MLQNVIRCNREMAATKTRTKGTKRSANTVAVRVSYKKMKLINGTITPLSK